MSNLTSNHEGHIKAKLKYYFVTKMSKYLKRLLTSNLTWAGQTSITTYSTSWMCKYCLVGRLFSLSTKVFKSTFPFNLCLLLNVYTLGKY